MQVGDMIRDGGTGATGRIVAVFADGAWAKRWPSCYRCDAVDEAVGGFTEFLGGYDGRVFLIEHDDRSVALVREHAAERSTGIHRALPPPELLHREATAPLARTGRMGRRPRPRCESCGGSGKAP